MKSSPTFRFWNAILHYQMLVLLVVRAQRQRNFVLYVEALEELVPLFFVLDHVNYAKWTSIHIRDMKSLPQSITEKFQDEGQFVLSRTDNDFSAMPFDQAHEQENKIVKSAGGAVGLTENPTAFRRWMLPGPETTRLLQQFEGQYLDDTDSETGDRANHETGLSSQKTFKIQVNNLIDVIRKMGNPFLDNFPELVTLDSRDCMDNEEAETIVNLDALGKSQYSSFLKDVTKDRTVAIGKPLMQNKLPLFRKQASRNKPKQSKTTPLLQNNAALFAQLYIAMQSRDAEFFSHEVQPSPPSLSEFGSLRLPTAKSDLLKCLSQPPQPEPPTEVDCKVCDGAVIVHCLPVTGVMTFDDYAENVFLPYIRNLRSRRVDIVWDSYIPNCLKEATREKRGTGLRRKVEGRTKIPPKWMEFLRDPRNKQELFQFLSVKVAEFPWFTVRKEVYITRRWMLSGPETTRLLQQFEGQYLDDTDSETGDRTNHETGLSSQKTFKIQVNNLIDVIRKMGNPFLDNFPELVTLDSRDCMDNEVAETIVNLDALESNVASSGEADSFLRVTYLKDQKLKSEAFSHSGDQLTTAEWEQTMKSSPTFRFWNAILHYQMLVLLVVRAQRQRNFVLYVEALEKLVPLFFVLDHVNYARWTPIHIRDMKSLPQSITEKFQDEGQFVLSRTGYDFSAMPFDQAHEQENKIVKSAGGAVGLTENPTAFRRWMLSGPETTRLLQQFEGQYLDDTDSETGDRTNHETGLSSQKTFKIQVNNLIDVIRKMGNPFLDNFPELVTLDSRDCMDNEVAETIVNLDALGKSQYSSFLKDVIKDRTVTIGKSLKHNKLPLFRKQASRNKSKQSKTISLLQNNVALFAQLYRSSMVTVEIKKLLNIQFLVSLCGFALFIKEL
ncbi:predicted protein [Nematostella vectensis]|uniref:Uncharacterized protein n=1 Tax=Nematostella vectensis TaxID=45351 RepID=A7T0A9_NEMVE|nr:predicted protein [Nematostella vectensis]|eukprot:XP_001622703.1 predicted protein [Nematostella vectensis]